LRNCLQSIIEEKILFEVDIKLKKEIVLLLKIVFLSIVLALAVNLL